MVVFVAVHAWPTSEHNGLAWLGSGGNLDRQLEAMVYTGAHPPASVYHVRAWPVIYGTLLTTTIALAIALPIALLSSIFIVEFAPGAVAACDGPGCAPARIGALGYLRADRNPRARAVCRQPPDHHRGEDTRCRTRVELTGASLLVVSVILAVMITPIMVALISTALAGVPASWREGAMALGVHRLRATLAVSLKAIRPAIVAATALACARALGEVIVVSMVSGSRSFAPNLAHGPLTFLYEPLRTLSQRDRG